MADVTRREYDERDEQIWNEAPPRDGIEQYAREVDPFYTAVRGERRGPVSNEAAERLRRLVVEHPMYEGDLDEALRTERRMVVEQIGDAVTAFTEETLTPPKLADFRAILDEIGGVR